MKVFSGTHRRRTAACSAAVGAALAAWAWSACGAESPNTVEALFDRKIASEDLLQISIVGEQLETQFRVSTSGTIQYPFLGQVKVIGLTPAELRVKLRQELMKDYFVDPQVIVTVSQYRQDFVSVLGQVNRPGPVQLTGERKMDILEVIALAGGLTRLAKEKIEYIHNGVPQTINLNDVKREKDPEKTIYVSPGDIIWVEERFL
jgi:polysaccharide export outer membrane protein